MTHSHSTLTSRKHGRLLSSLMLISLLAVLWPTGFLLADTCSSAGAIQLRSQVTVTPEERAWIDSLPAKRVG